MLSLEIEWLLDVCFAARSPADTAPDWPPQPDRVFSALTASWGARGTRADERAALEWLEQLPPPCMAVAHHCYPRTEATVFVPPNDPSSGDVRIMPERRRRQPRRFPATRLPQMQGAPHLRLIWQDDPSPAQFAALGALARDTSYIGHSSSLVRCAFLTDPPDTSVLRPVAVTNALHAGRLQTLVSLYQRHLNTADAAARPLRTGRQGPGVPTPPMPKSVFGQNWVVLEYKSGDGPDLHAFAVVGRAMRDALMSAWRDPIPEWLSGHQPDGSPSRIPHLAVVPLANVGFAWSDGSWHGLALVLPRAIEDAWTSAATPDAFANRQHLRAALHRLSHDGAQAGALALRLGQHGRAELRLLETPDQARLASLRPERYIQRAQGARHWSTATPIALDRHTKTSDHRAEAAAIIAESCTRIGLPRPCKIQVHKHAAISGALPAWPAGGAPAWSGWTRPGSLAKRPLFHATLQFEEAVVGPVILGAGRFFGLGLCLPVTGKDRA